MPVLEVEALRKVYLRGFWRTRVVAVERVDFTVEAGEIFGILGPNGAGKTTTIKCFTGLVHPTAGRAAIFGAPAGALAAKQRLGYLPENPYFYDYLTAREYVRMVGDLFGIERRTLERRVGELLDRVGLRDAGDRPMRSYSKGMMQRAGLAQALVSDPDLIVLDEPMSGLDPIGRKEVRDLIAELKSKGKTVVFCTHILGDASLLCDRVCLIVKGTVRDVGTLGALLSPKVHHVEIVWEGPDALRARLREAFSGEHRSSADGEIFLATDGAEVDRFVAALVAEGGHLVQVTPHRQTLEELFVSEANKTDGALARPVTRAAGMPARGADAGGER
jgi:ABC-2 type transport system ATP-binding protein